MKSAGFFGGSSGGVTSSSDSTTTARRSRYASYFGNASASRAENFAISASVFFSSCQKKRWRPSGKSGEEGRILGKYPIAEALQFQFANDSFLEQADEIRAGRNPVARPDLFGDRAPAEHFAAFEDQHLLAGAGKVSGGDQAVVAAADDDYVRMRAGIRNATTASGGSVIEIVCGRPWLLVSDETSRRRHFPYCCRRNGSESELRISR